MQIFSPSSFGNKNYHQLFLGGVVNKKNVFYLNIFFLLIVGFIMYSCLEYKYILRFISFVLFIRWIHFKLGSNWNYPFVVVVVVGDKVLQRMLTWWIFVEQDFLFFGLYKVQFALLWSTSSSCWLLMTWCVCVLVVYKISFQNVMMHFKVGQ